MQTKQCWLQNCIYICFIPFHSFMWSFVIIILYHFQHSLTIAFRNAHDKLDHFSKATVCLMFTVTQILLAKTRWFVPLISWLCGLYHMQDCDLTDEELQHYPGCRVFHYTYQASQVIFDGITSGQWEMLLQSNAISHWLGTNLESALSHDWTIFLFQWCSLC